MYASITTRKPTADCDAWLATPETGYLYRRQWVMTTTALPDEIAKLDNGTFVGWTRTGKSFDACAIDSARRAGRHAVCREYGRPDVAIDSHFYSASRDECVATLGNGGGAWGREPAKCWRRICRMRYPAPVPPGMCLSRVCNQRRDSNHRS